MGHRPRGGAVNWCCNLHSASRTQPAYLQSRQGGWKPELVSYEASAEASSDGGPGKVSLVGGKTADSKFRAIGRITEDSNQGGVELIRMVG